MSTESEKKCELTIDGYIRRGTNEYDINMPSEIVSIIFMFYFIKEFNIEYGKGIEVKENKITNIGDDPRPEFMNTTVIGDWMDPLNYGRNHIHTIKIKTIKHFADQIAIGIVEKEYNLKDSMDVCKGYAFCLWDDGEILYNAMEIATVNDYSIGDIVCLTLNLKSLSLSYSIFKSGDIESKQQGILLKAGEVSEKKYKWGVGIDTKGDCVEIMDVYSSN